MKKRVLLAAVLAIGCGNQVGINIPPSGGGGNNNNNNPPAPSLRELVVIPNQADNTVTVKQVNLNDGTTFTRSTVNSGGQGPTVVKCNTITNVFYVLNANSGLISEFRIDLEGNVTPIGNVASPANPFLMTLHPSGRLVFVAGSTGRQIFTYAVGNDGTLIKVAETATNFLNGAPGLDADFSGNGRYLHLPVMGGVQTCTIQNDGSLSGSTLNNAGGAIGVNDQVVDVDVHPGQTSLQASIQRAGTDAIGSFSLNSGTVTATSVTAVSYEVGLGDYSAPGRYYVGENNAPRVHGYNTNAGSGALSELTTSPSTSTGVNALYTQVDFTSSYVFSTQSVSANQFLSRSLSGGGEFNASTVDNTNLASPQLFDFFLVQVNGS
ncbi:MAG: beta-propeller fold lactonase family protein [Candidatus Eremiobacteraeota bacterium]|mgnify:CR=1 FL=1|nr:beta-propeller fold lactonase family protein [Candidatus Eremiobacteraeota bacterium]